MIKPTPSSIKQQAVFLKTVKRAKPLLTLRSSIGSAQLYSRDLSKEAARPQKLDRGLSRFTYSPELPLEVSAESDDGIKESWQLTPPNSDVPISYTIRLEMQQKGEGEVLFRGGRKLKMILKPIDLGEHKPSQDLLKERPLTKRIKLPAGTYHVSLINRKTERPEAQFNLNIYQGYRSEWQIKPIKQKTPPQAEEEDPKSLWSVDFTRFKKLKWKRR